MKISYTGIKIFVFHHKTCLFVLCYCRRPALVGSSLGVGGTSRSSVRIAWPTTTTDEDNVGSFGLKEMDKRRTASGGVAAAGCIRPTAHVLTDGSFVGVHVWFVEFLPRRDFLLFTKFSRLVDTCCYLNGVSAKQQISANILTI